MSLPSRPRRNRRNPAIRGLTRETRLHAEQLIYPLFVHAGSDDESIEAMPGCHRWSLDGLCRETERALSLGVSAVALFPKVDDDLKNPTGDEAWNDEGLIPQALERLGRTCPELTVICDVALDPYNSDGHDGIVAADGTVLNDETVEVLCRQAVCQARAGAGIVAPSDMMDGRVGAIRVALDAAGFDRVSVLSYTAKYASAFYGPFRGALDSAPKSGDKKTYQMDPANWREALREADLDVAEGADILMVKPAMPYLDVVRELANHVDLPLAAYQVSGEYLMIKSAAASGWLDEKEAVLESLTAIHRAGASAVLTYFACDAAKWLK